MTTLVHTCPDGPSNQQIDLLTPNNQKRSRVLTLDSSLVDNVSTVPGATVTQALDSLSGSAVALAPLARVNGWAPPPAGNTQALQLLPAGHAPGLYSIAWSVIVRVAAASGASLQATLTWTSVLGAELRALFNSGVLSSTGTLLQYGTTVQTGTGRQVPIWTEGTTAITINFASGAVTGAPIIDLFGAAIRIAAP
jgi:hypothetical protein